MAFKKSGLNYTQDSNNPTTYTDRTKINEHNEAIIERVRDDRNDEIRVIAKQSTRVNSHALLATAIDMHIGGQGFEAKRCELALDEVAKCFNLHLHIGGDAFDNANNDPNCKTNSMGNRVRPSEAPTYAYNLLNKPNIKSKIIAILGGNHDGEYGNRNKNSDMSIANRLADGLGVDYIPYAMIYSIPLLTPDTLEVKYQHYLFIHNAGNIDKATRLMQVIYDETGILVDGIMIEHLHKGQEGLYSVPVAVYDKQGKRLGDQNHDLFIGMGYSFQNANTMYGAEKMFANKTNMKLYDLSWQINPYSTKANEAFEPKYKPFINPFHALSMTEDKPSLALKLYQKDWALPEKLIRKENLQTKSIVELATKLNQAEKSYQENLRKYVEMYKSKHTEKQTVSTDSKIDKVKPVDNSTSLEV